MDLDTIIGVVVFIVFITWSTAFYVSLIPSDQNDAQAKVSDMVAGKIVDYVSSYVYTVPVIFDSGNSTSSSILYAEDPWYSGNRSTTRVFSGFQPLDCRIIGDDLYWETDLSTGKNYFDIVFTDAPEEVNCTGSFSVANATLAVPGGHVRERKLSLSRIYNLTNTSYESFRGAKGIAEDFRLIIDSASLSLEYGKSTSQAEDIFPIRKEGIFLWDSEPANVTIIVW